MFGSYLGDVVVDANLEGGGPKLFCAVTRNTQKKQLYVKLVNALSTPRTVDLQLDGGAAVSGKLVSLSAPDTQTTNTIDQPTRVIPAESALRVAGSTLHHTMPPFSIQVLQIDLR
jgi:alpha-N-arabinofuranosidase